MFQSFRGYARALVYGVQPYDIPRPIPNQSEAVSELPSKVARPLMGVLSKWQLQQANGYMDKSRLTVGLKSQLLHCQPIKSCTHTMPNPSISFLHPHCTKKIGIADFMAPMATSGAPTVICCWEPPNLKHHALSPQGHQLIRILLIGV